MLFAVSGLFSAIQDEKIPTIYSKNDFKSIQ